MKKLDILWVNAVIHCWQKLKFLQPFGGQFVKLHLLSEPQIPRLGIYPEDTLLAIWKYKYSSVFIVTLLIMAKYLKWFKCSIRKRSWINYVLCTQCSTLQLWEILLWTKMESFAGCIIKWKKVQKHIYIMCYRLRFVLPKFICGRPNPQYFRMWLYLEAGSLKMYLLKWTNAKVEWVPNPIWLHP